jgi:C1A family cysteine protease
LFPLYDQGPLGSCTGQAIAKAITFNFFKQQAPTPVDPSRLFIYYNERVIGGTVNEDSGAQIRDGIKSVVKLGVCSEELWPYDITRFAERPPQAAFDQAANHQALAYNRIPCALREMQDCLARGYPFVFGFSVYESFESDEVANTGRMSLPTQNDRVVGGHAVLCVGYDTVQQVFIVQNSWGDDWGDKGFFYMPFDYMLNANLADDRWVVTLMEDSA